jgi:FlgD Ig-like domain
MNTPAENPQPPLERSRPRPVVGVGLIVLFGVGLAVFLAPFAFPTPPPIVTRFQATKQFSPTGDGTREVARVAVRLNERSFVDVEVRTLDDIRIKGLIAQERPAGIVSLAWDGTDDQGRPAPDGRYKISLRATAGRKRFNNSRRVLLDRQAPPLGTLAVQSATLAGPGDGECRVVVAALDRGALSIEVLTAPGTPPIARFGPKIVSAGETTPWNWDGARADGGASDPGLYVVRAVLADTPGNRSEQSATCWVSHLIGATTPPKPKLGTRVGVQLRQLDGSPVPPATRVSLEIYRRTGTPGTGNAVLGERVGATAAGPVGSVRVQLPRKIPAAALWVVATTTAGRALIPLRP